MATQKKDDKQNSVEPQVLEMEDYAELKNYVLNVVAPHSFTVTLDARSKREALASQGLTKEQIKERMEAEARKVSSHVDFRGISLFELFEQFVLPQTTIKCRGFSSAPSDEELDKHLASFEGPVPLRWDSLAASPWTKVRVKAEPKPEELLAMDFSQFTPEQLAELAKKYEAISGQKL